MAIMAFEGVFGIEQADFWDTHMPLSASAFTVADAFLLEREMFKM